MSDNYTVDLGNRADVSFDSLSAVKISSSEYSQQIEEILELIEKIKLVIPVFDVGTLSDSASETENNYGLWVGATVLSRRAEVADERIVTS